MLHTIEIRLEICSERRHPVRVHRAGVCTGPRAAPSRVLGQMEWLVQLLALRDITVGVMAS
jgi:hypothetical protein